MEENQYYIYIMTNKYNTTIYVGVTNNLIRRVYEHKNKLIEGFTSKYNLNKLIYFENTENVETAILREKQIKNYSRAKKEQLIEKMNPERIDLYESLL
ncbi:GIY-YIG nuclease family protein [bacterium]|nr:GIY-YIG nuclease family protein [bacterium]